MEVEFPADEEEGDSYGVESLVASGLSLGGLEEAVEGFEESVGLSGSRPGGDGVLVFSDSAGDGLHGFDL